MAYETERREGKRDLFTVTVEYSVLSPEEKHRCSSGYGQTTNISNGGLSLLLNCPVEAGRCMALYGRNLSDGLLTGNVRWCSTVSRGIYRIGLKLN